MIYLLLLLALLATDPPADAPTFAEGQDPRPATQRWVPVAELSDEFDGSELDTGKWQSAPIGNDWSWDGRPPGLFLESSVGVDSGELGL